MFPDGVFSDLGEVLISPVPAGEADEGQTSGAEAPVREVVDRRKQLLARQVAGNAEENQSTRSGDSWQASVVGVAVDSLIVELSLPPLSEPVSPSASA